MLDSEATTEDGFAQRGRSTKGLATTGGGIVALAGGLWQKQLNSVTQVGQKRKANRQKLKQGQQGHANSNNDGSMNSGDAFLRARRSETATKLDGSGGFATRDGGVAATRRQRTFPALRARQRRRQALQQRLLATAAVRLDSGSNGVPTGAVALPKTIALSVFYLRLCLPQILTAARRLPLLFGGAVVLLFSSPCFFSFSVSNRVCVGFKIRVSVCGVSNLGKGVEIRVCELGILL
ncbi:hypothetical protein PIB30_076343 [Stylosanthes scabra]|uniref:Uncharacterized protein n=1 Tax=Stylosanthes scabra TaxID=79078 RepID=A0ABU6TPV6_9FABA|nr:hypothetical protein [Stylosanthes scabra]